MRKDFKKTFLAVSAVASILPFLASCTAAEKKDNYEDLSSKITSIVQQEDVKKLSGYDIERFSLIGADVAKTAFDYGVKFNGVVKMQNGDTGYASLGYVVPSEYFINLKKTSKHNDVFGVLDRIVSELKFSTCDAVVVKDISKTNQSIVGNAPTPFENYAIKEGLIYNLSAPTFNDESKTISFDVKTLVEVGKSKSSSGFGIGFGFDGTVGAGIGVGAPKRYTGAFTTLDRYNFSVDEEIYNQMKQNPEMVYDYVVEAINNKQSLFSAERVGTANVSYDEADFMDVLDISGLEDSLER